MRYLILSGLVIAWLYNLTLHKINYAPKMGFYFWTTKCKIPKDFPYKKYIKILDIGFDTHLKIIKTNCAYKGKFTPVIFIDNRVLNKISYKKIAKIIKRYTKNYKKVQFDCDWTRVTKEKYFALLKLFSDKYLTATIRLHQIKYFEQTGIPPVKKGILMFYNMSDFLDIKTENYILDLDVGKKYLTNFHYPLPLDIALPIYTQATIIRYGKVVGLIEGIEKKEFKNGFKKIKNTLYKVTKTHYFHERVVYKGDIIRFDSVSNKDLKKSINLLKDTLKKPINNIIFFRYNTKYFERFYKKGII